MACAIVLWGLGWIHVPLQSRGVAAPGHDGSQAAARGTPAKFCPTCKHLFPVTDRYCRVDGVPLAETFVAPEAAKGCPRCKKRFDGAARFCPHDGSPLQDVDTSDASPPAARGAVKNRVTDASPSALPRVPPRAGNDASSAARLGAAYVTALRAAATDTDPGGRDWGQAAAELDARFRLQRRIALALRIQVTSADLSRTAESCQNAIESRLRALGMRDLEIVSPAELPRTEAWKRLLLELSVRRAPNAPMQFELQTRECDLVTMPEGDGESGADERVIVDDAIAGRAILDTWTHSDARDEVPDGLTWEVVRRLRSLIASHFEEGRRQARDGARADAIEHYLRYLFATIEFDSPQAAEANAYVSTALGFSVLDWLWGEPAAAVVEHDRLTRRLPLGFRAASGEPPSGELPRVVVSLRDGSEMVLVPGGTEFMGNDAGPAEERPAHPVGLRSFYVDKLEVSVAQYEKFLAAGEHRVPAPDNASEPVQWSGRQAKSEFHQLPVVQVSWHDARAYAQWCGKALPTEAQWERAARGRWAADYPRSIDVNFDRNVNAGQRVLHTTGWTGVPRRSDGRPGTIDERSIRNAIPLTSVFSFPAALNPYGCQNMLGNAAEWCRDWYDAEYYSETPSDEPLGPESGVARVVRGGSWQAPVAELGPTRRASMAPSTRNSAIGFRCVLNLPAE